jgi:hypothetical protein
MRGLTPKQQKAVRTALRFMRFRVGAWVSLAKALHLATLAREARERPAFLDRMAGAQLSDSLSMQPEGGCHAIVSRVP